MSRPPRDVGSPMVHPELQDVCWQPAHLGKGARCALPLHPSGITIYQALSLQDRGNRSPFLRDKGCFAVPAPSSPLQNTRKFGPWLPLTVPSFAATQLPQCGRRPMHEGNMAIQLEQM